MPSGSSAAGCRGTGPKRRLRIVCGSSSGSGVPTSRCPRRASETPVNRSYVPGGYLLTFLVLHDLVSHWFLTEARRSIARLRRREITGPDLYQLWGGVLASDMVSDTGNEFLFHLLRMRAKHGSRYGVLLNRLPGGPYQMLPGWDAYDQVAPSLEEEFLNWRSRRRASRLLRFIQPPPRF